MTARLLPSRAWPWVASAALLALAGMLAAALAPELAPEGGGADPVMARLLGSSVRAFGETLLDRADATFHRGREGRPDRTAITNDLFQAWRAQIQPAGHVHLAGEQMKEVMAWLRMASWFDPADVRSALVASYWMAGEMGRPKEAMQILLEAQAVNPGSYLVYLGRARLYAKLDDRTMARRCYDRALQLWPSGLDPKDDDVRLDRRELLARRAVLGEMDGDIAGAVADMRAIVALFPERPSGHFRRRIAQLERGEKPEEGAEQRWSALRNERMRHSCEKEEAGHDESEHHSAHGAPGG